MPTVRKVDAVFAKQIVNLLEARGKPVKQVLREVGLDVRQMAKPESRIPFAKYGALVQAASVQLQDPCFGLHFGSGMDLLDAGALGYVTASAPTLGDALKKLTTYIGTFSEGGKVWLEDDGVFSVLTGQITDPDAAPRRQYTELEIAAGMNICRFVTGRRIQAEQIEFAHGRNENVEVFEKYFGGPVLFGAARNAITFRRSDMDLPCVRADERLLGVLTTYCDELLANRTKAGDFKTEVESHVVRLLPSGTVNADTVAMEFGMSPRTFARRLKQQGLTFGRLLDNMRHSLAFQYLKEPSFRPSQIAYLLGYSEPAAFNNAFRRWAGKSPSSYRAAL